MALGVAGILIELVTPTDLRRLQNWVASSDFPTGEASRSPADLLDPGAANSRLLELWDALLLDAIAERASDLHLERSPSGTHPVRIRVDGNICGD